MPRKRKAEQGIPPSPQGDQKASDAQQQKPSITIVGADGKVKREETPPQSIPEGTSCFKALSWNVNGLRAILSKHPERLKALVEEEVPDYVCLQEHKLKQEDLEWGKAKLAELLPSFVSHWSFSTVKKGYSGTVVLLRSPPQELPTSTPRPKKQKSIQSFFGKKAPSHCSPAKDIARKGSMAFGPHVDSVTFDMEGQPNTHAGEGRLITVEYERFFIVGAYVPNSGQKLERLKYRTEHWDRDLQAYMLKLQERKPVILTGDLNVAHQDIDIWNVSAKHIPKSAGTTPAERESFGQLLSAGFVDAFRHFYPAAKGCFTQWSIRVGNRPFNKGLRLDYFVVPSGMAGNDDSGVAASRQQATTGSIRLVDCQIRDQAAKEASDHCPITLTLSGT